MLQQIFQTIPVKKLDQESDHSLSRFYWYATFMFFFSRLSVILCTLTLDFHLVLYMCKKVEQLRSPMAPMTPRKKPLSVIYNKHGSQMLTLPTLNVCRSHSARFCSTVKLTEFTNTTNLWIPFPFHFITVLFNSPAYIRKDSTARVPKGVTQFLGQHGDDRALG